MRELTATELQIKKDENGFIGTGVKGETILECSSLDKLLVVWKDGKYGFGQNLLVGDQLLIQAEDGYVVVADASPEAFRETARIDALESMTWNPPTLAGRYLLVRNDKEVICFRLSAKSDQAPAPAASENDLSAADSGEGA